MRCRFLNTCANLLLACAVVLFIAGAMLLYSSINIQDTEQKPFIRQFDENLSKKRSILRDWRAFRKFQRDFSKRYSNASEEMERFENFRQNLKKIRNHNAHRVSKDMVRFGITQFADFHEYELLQFVARTENVLLEAVELKMNATSTPATKSSVMPKQIDWRKKGIVTPVKNQRNCGSCWAFATVAAVESQYALSHLNQSQMPLVLSEQQLLDCDLSNNACNGGDRFTAFSYIKREGLVPEEDYPYEARQSTCRLPSTAKRIHIDKIQALSTNEDDIASWLATHGPVTFGMAVTREMFLYHSGVFSPSREDCTQHRVGAHAMEVVGYDVTPTGTPYWILKNSWGAAYGVNGGYLHMLRGADSCGLAQHVFAAIIQK